jgi:hypothetical protein
MKELKFNRMKTILGILLLVFVVVPLITVSANGQNSVSANTQNYNNHMRPFPYGMPTLYQQNNSSYIGPFYPPAPYGGSPLVCGPYGCYWTGADVSYLIAGTIADNGW